MIVKVGEIGVDAGLCWIGDPCYIHKNEGEEVPKEWGKTWIEFLETLWSREEKGKPTAVQFNYDLGHPGLGVCVSTGYGDGTYPVFAEISDEGKFGLRIKKIWVEFFWEEDEEGEPA
jgi:hypothetical protein